MRKYLAGMVVALGGWCATVPALAVPVLSLVPSSPSTTVGGNVSVNLVISGLSSISEIVSGFDLDVFFDSSVLNASSLTTVFTPWGSGSNVLLEQNFVAPGHVEFVLTALSSDAALAALQGDSFVLSTISFAGLANGFSNVTYGLDPDFERNVVGRNSLSLPLTVQGTCVAVGTGSCAVVPGIPEPGTLPLALLALGATALAVRRAQKA